jgi:saccharopine dehydrogenase-like NADP-dependent oxidoreductase
MNNKTHIGIVGAGKIGSSIYELLVSADFGYKISVADQVERRWNIPEENYTQLTITKPTYEGDCVQFKEFVKGKSIIINALPYYQNINLYKDCCEFNVPYFDLSEDDALDNHIKTLEKIPFTMRYCGLAPGMSSIVAFDLLKRLSKPQTLKIRVGALSQNADNKLRYYTSWSAEGLVNEYIGDCQVVRRGRQTTVPALSGYEKIAIGQHDYECFHTSGGIGTLAKSIESRYNPFGDPPSTIHADYKTVRRIGHHHYVDFLFNDLQLDQVTLTSIFNSCIPQTRKDVVIIYATASSLDKEDEVTYYKVFKPRTINGRHMSAIEYTTAIGLVSMVELFVEKKIPQEGYVKQEDVEWKEVLSTKYGCYYRETEENIIGL